MSDFTGANAVDPRVSGARSERERGRARGRERERRRREGRERDCKGCSKRRVDVQTEEWEHVFTASQKVHSGYAVPITEPNVLEPVPVRSNNTVSDMGLCFFASTLTCVELWRRRSRRSSLWEAEVKAEERDRERT